MIDLVLVGGGHTHVQVLKSFGMNPIPGVRLILIAKELNAPYSGMLPGLMAGHYTFEDCHIDLIKLGKFANARIVHGTVNGIDRAGKQVAVEGRAAVAYDLLSIDIGITPNLDGIDGAFEHAIAVKPISTFWPKWEKLQHDIVQPDGKRKLVVIGAGAAGFELSLSANYRFRGLLRARGLPDDGLTITLVAGDTLLSTHNRHARKLAYRALEERGVRIVEGDRARNVTASCVELQSGAVISCEAALVTTGASPASWFSSTDLPLDAEGYLALRPTLQLEDDDTIFAAGDCASVHEFPREKSGVFAVRQGPPLTENLRGVASGGTAKPFAPQKDFLTLLSLGDASAIAARGPFAAKGRWAWWWKDWIDQSFMSKFKGF